MLQPLRAANGWWDDSNFRFAGRRRRGTDTLRSHAWWAGRLRCAPGMELGVFSLVYDPSARM